MEPKEAQRQIRLMHEQGFGGFFMHSRVGLETPYMSPAWMSVIRASMEAACIYDMEAWLYDEDKWPSGFAGGAVPALGQAYRVKGLKSAILQAIDLAKVWPGIAKRVAAGEDCWLYRLELENERLTGFTRLLAAPHDTATGCYLLCYVHTVDIGEERFNGQSYVDLLDARVTQAFLASTHAVYLAEFAQFFGANVPGVFTDEPHYGLAVQIDAAPW
jgi:hypothetical protein